MVVVAADGQLVCFRGEGGIRVFCLFKRIGDVYKEEDERWRIARDWRV